MSDRFKKLHEQILRDRPWIPEGARQTILDALRMASEGESSIRTESIPLLTHDAYIGTLEDRTASLEAELAEERKERILTWERLLKSEEWTDGLNVELAEYKDLLGHTATVRDQLVEELEAAKREIERLNLLASRPTVE